MVKKIIKGFNKKKFKVYAQNKLNLGQVKNLGRKLKAEKWSFLRFNNDFRFFPRTGTMKLKFFHKNILNIRRTLKTQNCFLSSSNLFKIYRKAKKGNSKYLKFLNIMESRLDVALFRTGFFKSPVQLRHFISHGNIYLNGVPVNKPGIFLKKNDLVQIDFTNLDLVYNQLFKNQKKVQNVVYHLEINLSSFSFIYLGYFKKNQIPYTNKDNLSFLNYVFKR